jgi:hypothetical protein
MRTQNTNTGRNKLLPSLLLIVILTACGSPNADATPTLSVDQIFTAAAQTLQAQQATALALTPPTNTPSPSPFPTLPPPSPAATISFGSPIPTGGGATSCDNSAYVSDVTIPDGTTMKPGEKFTKTWRIYNSGSCAWSTSYILSFLSGDAMGGASTALAAAVPAGSQADVSVALTAPTTNGTFKGNWRMQNAGGQPFGSAIYVEIKVGAGSTVTPGPSPTGGPSPTSGGTSFRISGSAGVGSGVTVWCMGANANKPNVQATVDNDGNYFCMVINHWAGSIEPSKPGWNFSPPAITGIDDVTADLPDQNFTASQ